MTAIVRCGPLKPRPRDKGQRFWGRWGCRMPSPSPFPKWSPVCWVKDCGRGQCVSNALVQATFGGLVPSIAAASCAVAWTKSGGGTTAPENLFAIH
uniref:Uncharacterized protein n=1 Tax=Eutreptiella gymnastica TaxID=73025 RepID=A0A7S4CD18_9EUGL